MSTYYVYTLLIYVLVKVVSHKKVDLKNITAICYVIDVLLDHEMEGHGVGADGANW